MSTFVLRPKTVTQSAGFTLIELMIVIAIIAIILTIALPVYSGYAIRAKIGEGLGIAMAVKTSVSETCNSNRGLSALTNGLAGFAFTEDPDPNAYVQDIQVSGPCTDPVITVTTKNTGAIPDPIITIIGSLPINAAQIEWRCTSANTEFNLLPSTCRSSS